MPIYVDDMECGYRRMKMSHMLADTDYELHAMADLIGVRRKWWQPPNKSVGSHYDISLGKKALAIKAGAIQITQRQASAMNARRRMTGELGDPATALAWFRAYRAARRGEGLV